jgi:hypothetical protein
MSDGDRYPEWYYHAGVLVAIALLVAVVGGLITVLVRYLNR